MFKVDLRTRDKTRRVYRISLLDALFVTCRKRPLPSILVLVIVYGIIVLEFLADYEAARLVWQ